MQGETRGHTIPGGFAPIFKNTAFLGAPSGLTENRTNEPVTSHRITVGSDNKGKFRKCS